MYVIKWSVSIRLRSFCSLCLLFWLRLCLLWQPGFEAVLRVVGTPPIVVSLIVLLEPLEVLHTIVFFLVLIAVAIGRELALVVDTSIDIRCQLT